MSGFVAGALHRPDPGLATELGKMSEQIAHRGDISATEFFSAQCAVATRYRQNSGFRVHTYADANHALVIDGLIFNSAELAAIAGADRSAGIAQVILLGYLRFGNSWFSRLDGCFALIVMDLRTGIVIIARDRFGHRPLYFGMAGGCTWVASEIKPILAAPNFQRLLNEDAIPTVVGYGVTTGPDTLFAGVYKCLPGFAFKTDGDSDYVADIYYSPVVKTNRDLTLQEAKTFIASSLGRTTSEYARECPELGVLLSGGVDSALLAYDLSAADTKNSVAVSFGASGWQDDESSMAAEIAAQVNLAFVRTNVSVTDDLLGSIRSTIWALEEPTRFEWAVASEMAYGEASGLCRGLLTGYAADVILGESQHRGARRLAQILCLPKFLRRAIIGIPINQASHGRLAALQQYAAFNSVEDYVQTGFANCMDLVPKSNKPPAIKYGGMICKAMESWPAAAQYTGLVSMEFGHSWVEALERMAAVNCLECFHPFMRNELLQFGLELPDDLRNLKGVNKPAMRALAADRYEQTVAYRKKRQFAAPMRKWLNESEQLRAAVLNLKNPGSQIRSHLDNCAIDRYLDIYEKEGADSIRATAPALFRMLGFELWLEMYFDRC